MRAAALDNRQDVLNVIFDHGNSTYELLSHVISDPRNIPLLQYILNNGISGNTSEIIIDQDDNIEEQTILDEAIWGTDTPNKQIVRLLLEHGADPNRIEGSSFIGAARTSMAMVNLFLEFGVDLERFKDEALIEATDAENTAVVRFLLRKGADPDYVGRNGSSARDKAIENHNSKYLHYFATIGAEE